MATDDSSRAAGASMGVGMTFSDWKRNSKVFNMFRDRAEREGIGLKECCQAAYKAGERQGRKDAEEMAKRATVLRELMKQP